MDWQKKRRKCTGGKDIPKRSKVTSHDRFEKRNSLRLKAQLLFQGAAGDCVQAGGPKGEQVNASDFWPTYDIYFIHILLYTILIYTILIYIILWLITEQR